MGQIYYDMGFLADTTVLEISASEIIGQYVGQTAPKVQAMLDKAAGRILFIDEAYRLGEGQFASEAVNELVDSLTKPKYMKKLVVILAGYDEDINRLMTINAGLTSRFPEAIVFEPLSPEHSLDLLGGTLASKQLDTNILSTDNGVFRRQIWHALRRLSATKSWGNARDVKYLADKIFNRVLIDTPAADRKLEVTESIIKAETEALYRERADRNEADVSSTQAKDLSSQATSAPIAQPRTTGASSVATASKSNENSSELALTTQPTEDRPERLREASPSPVPDLDTRDDGVSDETWRQLQTDRQRAHDLEQQRVNALKDQEKILQTVEHEQTQLLRAEASNEAAAASALAAGNVAAKKRLEDERRALLLERERARLQEAMARRERERVERLVEEEVRKQIELRRMGICAAGFRWIKQAGGYRCAGGSHFVGDGLLQ